MEILDEGGVPIHIWANIESVEAQALQQLGAMSRLPIIGGHIAVMPDVHLGKGACVGSVIPTRGAIVPASVGVDIGCGMLAARLSLTAKDLPDSLATVRAQIERDIPVGQGMHSRLPRLVESAASQAEVGLQQILDDAHGLLDRRRDKTAWASQIGTLGGVSLIENNPVKNCQSTLYSVH